MKKGFVIPLVLFVTAIVFAGGFHISVESGSGRNESLIVKTFGCHTPSDATLTGIAEGIVNGKRETINLQFKQDKKGVFTIAKQWKDEGVWVISIKGYYNEINSVAVIELDSKTNMKLAKGEKVRDLKIKFVREEIKPEGITKILNNLNKNYTGV